MAVTNPQTPAAYNFSKNFIPLRFLSDNYLEQTGITAINHIDFSGAIAADSTIKITFGQTVLTFTAKAVPDDSALQFPSGTGDAAYVASLVSYFQDNDTLSNNFVITAANLKLIFTAKKQANGLNFVGGSGSGYNISNATAGRPALQRTNFGIRFVLYCQTADHAGYEIVHSADLPVDFNSAGIASVDINQYLNSYLEKDLLDIPDTGSTAALTCTKSCRKFYYTYAESWGQPATVRKKHISAEFTVLAGGLSFQGAYSSDLESLIVPNAADQALDRFLKQGSSHQYTREDQPQFLYFFNTRAALDGNLRVRYYFTDGTDSGALTITAADVASVGKIAFNVTYNSIFTPADFPNKIVARYEVWLETTLGAKVSETRTYWMNYKAQQYVRYFLSWSSWGAMDTRLCYGKATSGLELVQQEAQRILKAGYDIKKGNSTIFDVKLSNKFKASTGHISRTDLIHNRDFYASPHKFRYVGGKFLPIKVTSKDIPEIPDGETLFYQEFEYTYRFDDDVFTEGDVDEPGLGIGSFFFNSVIPSLPSNGIIETDPTVPSWVKSITQADINKWNLFNQDGYNKVNWDTAYSWGNHNAMGYALSANHYDKTTSDARYIQNRYDYQTDARLNVKGGKFLNYLVVPNAAPSVTDMEEGECAIYFDTSGLGGGAPQPPVIANFPDLGDVDISGRLDGYEVYWNATTSKYMHRAPAGSGVSSWNDLTDKPTTLSGYGIQTEGDGRWLGINATAANSTQWNGYTMGSTVGTSAQALMGYDATAGTLKFFTPTALQTTLGLASAAYLNASQTVAAGTLVQRNSDNSINVGTAYWDGTSASDFIGQYQSDGKLIAYSVAQMQGRLGLGSNAFTSTAYLPLTGGTITGQLNLQRSAITASNPLVWKTNSTDDWFLGSSPLGTSTSDLSLYSYGTNSEVWKIEKATGKNFWISSGTFGLINATNLLVDINQINARFNGAGSTLYLNYTDNGSIQTGTGAVTFGGALTGTSATFSGSVYLGHTNTLGFKNSTGTDRQVITYTDQVIYDAMDGGHYFRTGTGYTQRYVIDPSGNHDFKSGTATFGGALTGTSATMGNARINTWSGDGAWARFGHSNLDESGQGFMYGYMQSSGGDLTMKGNTSINFETPIFGSSATFRENGTSDAWRGKIHSANSLANRQIFIGTYGTKSVLASHSYTLDAWADLYINTVDGGGGGNVFMGGTLSGMKATFASSSNTDYSYTAATVELREASRGQSGSFLAPRLSFHWAGVVASQIGIESNGRIAILNNPGTGYENFIAKDITASLLASPKVKANTLLTIPTIAPNVNDMANGEVAIWAEGFN